MKTLKAIAVIGVNKGYSGENKEDTPLSKATKIWQEVANEFFNETGIYISAVAIASKTVYKTDWGCPEGGEDTVEFTTTANPAFVQDLAKWKEAVEKVVKEVKKRLEQSTVTIEFQEISDFIYLH